MYFMLVLCFNNWYFDVVYIMCKQTCDFYFFFNNDHFDVVELQENKLESLNELFLYEKNLIIHY